MPNLSSLASATTAASTIGNLVLVTPQATIGYQPQNKANSNGAPSSKQTPPAILFHYEGEQSIKIQSDITDHFVEDNTALQDNIALKPEIVTTKGYIGELNNVVPDVLKSVKFIADKLTVIGGYTPQLTTTGLILFNAALQAYQLAQNALNAAVNTWASVSNMITGETSEAIIGSDGLSGFDPATGKIDSRVQNKQQLAFQQLYGYWRLRTLFTVQTPWAVFTDMAISSITPVQDESSRMVSEFSVEFKKIRTASTILTRKSTGIFDGRAQNQAAGLVDLGSSSPVPGPSLSSGLATMGIA
jgi:hypothetical protein